MEKMEWVRSRIGFQGMIVVEAKGRSEGLAMLWKDQDQVDLLSISDNHIDIAISENGVHTWRLTGFYGEPDRSKRRRTWELLKNLSRDSNLPWCTIGDMNNILSQSDKRGGAPYPQWLLEGFNKTVMEAGLTDLELYGHEFTWERDRNMDAWIEIRLDRALATESWLQLFPDAKLYNLEGSSSDHSAIFLDLFKTIGKTILGWQKIQRCAENLGDRGKEITGGFNKRICECHQKLKQLRRRRDAQSLQEYKDTKHQLYLILDQKEIFWRQRSKQLWFNAGDKNTKYFHAACNKRQRTNRITKLKDGSGEWLDWQNGLENLIQSFYSNLFTATQVDYEEVVDCVSQTLDHEHNSELTKDVTREEVRFAIFQMHPDKAPGPDGMTPTFFQKHWQTLLGRMYTRCQLSHLEDLDRVTLCHPIFSSYVPKGCRRFYDANPEEALRMRDLLEIYERATGQQVNKSKSAVFYSTNVLQYNREPVGQILQMQEANEHSTYLGLPNIIGKNKSALLGYLKDKVNAKIRTWNGNFISRSGKEILVKHVAQTLPTYAMNVFLLPLEITRNIEQCLANFWWNSGKANSSSLHWMSWDRLARDKNAGGMGFRHFRDFNIAMLGKQLWRLITNPTDLVARLYKAKYFATVDVFQAELGHNPSFIWRSLLEAKQLLLDGSRWRVGDGQHIQILGQPWLLTEVNPFITSNIQPLQNQVVASLIKVGAKEWDLEVVADVLNERDQNCVLAVPISNSNQEDSLYWSPESSGIYSVKSAYKLLQLQRNSEHTVDNGKMWKTLWNIRAPPKVLNLVWRALSDCLPTLTQLQLKRVPVQNICPTCQTQVESIMHCLVSCSYAQQCWSILLPGIQIQEDGCFKSWLSLLFDTIPSSKYGEVVTLCWALWRSRNDLVWNQKTTKINRTVAAAKQYLAQWKTTQGRFFTTPLQPHYEGDGATIWVKPPPNKVKVSVDAAVFEDQNGIGFGLVARDSKGDLIEATTKFQPGLVAPIVAEAMAFKEALSWMDDRGWHDAAGESDCLAMVQAIRSTTPMRSYFGSIIEDCRCILQSLNNISLSFVKRPANMVAHQLARESYYLSGRKFDRSNVPSSILHSKEALDYIFKRRESRASGGSAVETHRDKRKRDTVLGSSEAASIWSKSVVIPRDRVEIVESSDDLQIEHLGSQAVASVIADYKASQDFQEVLNAEYDANFPDTFATCWEHIVGEIGKKVPGVTLEASPVPPIPGKGSSDEDLSPSLIHATSAEATTSPLQDATPMEDNPIPPSTTVTDGGNDDDLYKDLD
ncbi:uncharacterized protein LOC141698038 [Apium graveolens]|uniref:uncharacterized protein LOC141698038 n=1 Tax=Apium graveolens TaxID=4045 RepID=UPI003D7B2926